MKPTFNYLVSEATRPEASWSNADLANFHYFNPNGLYAAKKARDERISALVFKHDRPTGAIYAYGSMNSYNADRLMSMVNKRRVNAIKLAVTLEMLQADIDKADQWINENK